jgi:hypothetical protein
MRIVPSTVAAALLATLASGCGEQRPALVPVTGTVVSRGQPLAGAVVSFRPLGANAYHLPGQAVTGANGKYRALTGDRSGLLPGAYEVTVTTGANPATARVGDTVRVEGTFRREVPPSGGVIDLNATPVSEGPQSH